jgi:hypothetical protein
MTKKSNVQINIRFHPVLFHADDCNSICGNVPTLDTNLKATFSYTCMHALCWFDSNGVRLTI